MKLLRISKLFTTTLSTRVFPFGLEPEACTKFFFFSRPLCLLSSLARVLPRTATMRLTSFVTLSALGVAAVISGLQDVHDRNLDAIHGSHSQARDLSTGHLPIKARAAARTKPAAKPTKSATSSSFPLKRSRVFPRNLFPAKGTANKLDGCDWALSENEYMLGSDITGYDTVCIVHISGCSAVTFRVAGKKTSAFHILASSESDGEVAARLVNKKVGKATEARIATSDIEKFNQIKFEIHKVFPGLPVKPDDIYGKVTENRRYRFQVDLETGEMVRTEYTSTSAAQPQ